MLDIMLETKVNLLKTTCLQRKVILLFFGLAMLSISSSIPSMNVKTKLGLISSLRVSLEETDSFSKLSSSYIILQELSGVRNILSQK